MSLEEDVDRVKKVTEALVGAENKPKVLKKVTIVLDEKQIRQAVCNFAANDTLGFKYWRCYSTWSKDKNGNLAAGIEIYQLDRHSNDSDFDAKKEYEGRG